MADTGSVTAEKAPSATFTTAFHAHDEWDEDEAVFNHPGDLGISVRVDDDGGVVVSKLLQLRGYAELSCPTLHGGDVLVAIDSTPIVDLSFADVMQRLHATAKTRPTRLEFLGVDRFASADEAVQTWKQTQHVSQNGGVDDDPRFREGEFDVAFTAQQPTGLRFSEGYMMAHPLKLAHIEMALLGAMGLRGRSNKDTLRGSLLQTILIRVGDDSVLGAPVDDVMALLYDAESFPKTLWLANAERLQEDYQVVTLRTREQLKWLCFVPVEMMMEVPVVSYAALAKDKEPDSTGGRRRTRSDGIREGQYLMAINGFPTLRLSVTTSFTDDKSHASAEGESIVALMMKSLDSLLATKRIMRFRDLKAYRREFLAHEPLSPWRRRRRTRTSTSDSTAAASVGNSTTTSPMATGRERHSRSESVDEALIALAERLELDLTSVGISHCAHSFSEIIKEQAHQDDDDQEETAPQSDPDNEKPIAAELATVESPHPQRPVIKRYHGLANCEGVRSFTPAVPENLKTVVIPDNRRQVGIQLETDVLLSGRPVFKNFVRRDGPALSSRQVRVGDRILSVNGVPIDEIPTDMLVRILHGEDGDSQSADLDASTPLASHEGSRKRLVSEDSTRRRVLRLARKPTPGSPHLQGMLSHARKLLTLSRTKLSLWPSAARSSSAS